MNKALSPFTYKRTEPFPARAVYEVWSDGTLLGHVWQGTQRQGWQWCELGEVHTHMQTGWDSREAAARELRHLVESRTPTKPGTGWWNMVCWNALSSEQQRRLIEVGNLPINYRPHGTQCNKPAEVAVETMWDKAEGPRFYCTECAVQHLKITKAVKTS